MVTIILPIWFLWVFAILMSAECILSIVGIYYRRKLLKIKEENSEI